MSGTPAGLHYSRASFERIGSSHSCARTRAQPFIWDAGNPGGLEKALLEETAGENRDAAMLDGDLIARHPEVTEVDRQCSRALRQRDRWEIGALGLVNEAFPELDASAYLSLTPQPATASNAAITAIRRNFVDMPVPPPMNGRCSPAESWP